MDKYCCVCERPIQDGDYDRIGQDYYCPACSNNNLVPCPICETCINPDVDTKFQAPDKLQMGYYFVRRNAWTWQY